LRRVESAAVMGESLRWVFDGLVPPERIVVVPNGTPPLQCEHVDPDPDHVVFLGNLRRRKGVAEAVEAALLVRKRRPATRFTFAGSWESDELEQTLRGRVSSQDGTIVFRSSVEGREKDALLASASVLLFPPVEPEGHPRVVLEAMAAGVPVVTTNRGAISETVENGVCGFVLDDALPAELAESLLVLLEDDSLRRSFGLTARRTWQERFTQGHADEALAQWLSRVACQ
jgi:glycosyltransferase involved in cell wall biosynthesis